MSDRYRDDGLAFALALCTSAWAGSVTYSLEAPSELVAVVSARAVAARRVPVRSSPAVDAGGDAAARQQLVANYFMTQDAGYDKTVTFIENTTYGWHTRSEADRTIWRRTRRTPERSRPTACHHSYFWGSCNVSVRASEA